MSKIYQFGHIIQKVYMDAAFGRAHI